MEEVKKKDILLNLADLDDTARVCRALSSETRLEANLISVVPKPGIRGSQKLCGMKTLSLIHIYWLTPPQSGAVWD